MFYILARKAIDDIGDLRNNTRMRVRHRFENRCTCIQYVCSVYHPECTKRLIKGKLRTVTEVYELHRLLFGIVAPNGMVKKHFFIHLHPSYSSIRNYQQ